MLYGLLLINKDNGEMTVLTGPSGVRVWATPGEAEAHGDLIYGKDNANVAYQAVVVGAPIK